MSSLINKYYHQDKKNEQAIMNGLIRESIQLQGNTYYYLPRDVQVEDLLMGEDVISAFLLAIPIEMYLASAGGFMGDKEMFSKFGLELRNSYKLVVHKDRWEEEVKTQFDISQANGEANFVVSNYIRPREGDLIYDPLTKYLMEIKFVDHDVEFYSLGKNYQYYLSCEAFSYQSEVINTGIPAIDIFTKNSIDLMDNLYLLEQGGRMIREEGSFIVLEDDNIVSPQRVYGSDFTADATTLNVQFNNPFGI